MFECRNSIKFSMFSTYVISDPSLNGRHESIPRPRSRACVLTPEIHSSQKGTTP